MPIIYDQDLYEFCVENRNKSANKIVRHPLRPKLIEETSILNVLNPCLKDRIMFVAENRDSIPKCPICDKDLPLVSHHYKFAEVCSDKCRSIASAKYHEKMDDRDWLYEQRINLERSYESIAEEMNIPAVSLKKQLKKYEIPERNYNGDRYFEVQSILSNRDFLYDLSEKMSAADIAKKLECNSDIVLKYYKIHGIETKPCNSWPRKFVKRSAGELEVQAFVESFYDGEIKSSDRSILGGCEIDILLPELNVGFEFNGVYYHSEIFKERLFHYNKTTKAKEKGVDLYHIFEDDWKYKKDIWKSRIKSLMGLSERRLYARKCKTKEIDVTTKNEFLNLAHLQKKDSSKYKYGLFFEDELVAVMTFRENPKYGFELLRFACLKGTSIVGGFSKLLAAFRREHAGGIVSYADLAYSL